MAVLPVSDIILDAEVQITDEPSRTWYIDRNTNRIQGYCDNYIATKQAVEIILHTDRFLWGIYEPSSGVDYSGLIGEDPGYVAVELQRRIKEALLMDNRVLGISDYSYEVSGDRLGASFVVNTVFGDMAESVEVSND